MGERLDLKFLARYPFLKESQEYVGERVLDLDRFLSSGYGRLILNRGAERVMASIGFKGVLPGEQVGEPERALYSYALARVIVSCIGERDLIERLCRYEAAKATALFLEEGEEGQKFVSSRLGIDLGSREMPVVKYVELASFMRFVWRGRS
jgi:DNA primase large subunit